MRRLIDADVALAAVKPYEPSDEMWSVTGGTAIRLIHSAIDNTPTVDAVTVVRCRDCGYWDAGVQETSSGKRYARCWMHTHLVNGKYIGWCPTENDFCSRGKRRDAE